MPQKLFILLFFLISAGLVAAQKPVDSKTTEEAEKLRKDAVVFLRETLVEVNGMRSLENRISFGAEMASLMWFYDEKEARAMYKGVTGDFRQLLIEFDAQLNKVAQASSLQDGDDVSAEFMAEVTNKGNIHRKFQKALELRQQIAMSLAEHEPDMALAFYYDSVASLTNSELRDRSDDRDSYFETQLVTQIAETNAAKATDFAIKSISKGVGYQHIDLLRKIYAKDAAKGIEFASAMVSKYKGSGMDGSEPSVLALLIRFGEETSDKTTASKDKKPVLTNQDMRDLTEVLAQAILAGDEESDLGNGHADIIEKYAPSRAAQIRARGRGKGRSANANSASYAVAVRAANTADAAVAAANAAANAMAATATPNPEAERRAKALEERLEAEKKVMADVESLATKPLPKEEREKIVSQARKMISRSAAKEQKIMGLSMLAAQVAKAGDKELAGDIMKEAESLTNLNPKNYQDFLLTWMLISGYAEVDANKAFPMLTDTILKLNDTIAAFVKAAEFIDVEGEIIDDGEVQVGQFGGSMLRSITKELKIAEPTLRSLAKADFARTKAVTNNFDRAEVRVLAKMMVLRTILGGKEGEKDDPNIGLVLN